MLGKGLESLIPSGGYKPQPNGEQNYQAVGQGRPAEQAYHPAPPAQPLYEASRQAGYYQPIVNPVAEREPQILSAPIPSQSNVPTPPAYYDYTAPIVPVAPVAPREPQYDRFSPPAAPVESLPATPITSQQPVQVAGYGAPQTSFATPSSTGRFVDEPFRRPTSAYQSLPAAEEIRPAPIPSYDGFAATDREREIVPSFREDYSPIPEAGVDDYSRNGGTVYQIDVSKIFPNPHQPRRYFDDGALNDLASSIREFGIIQPLVVTKVDNQTGEPTYQLIAGERRLMAAKRVGLKTVPAVIKSVVLDRERLELAIIENIQRENLNPLEAARSYARLQDEFNLTQREIAGRMGKSRETIANTLRLLNLPTEIQQALEEGRINESHARLLLQVDDIAKQKEMFSSILRFKPSVRELKAQLRRGAAAAPGRQAYSNPELLSLQSRLEETLGTKVQINDEGDKGKITINYYSADELSDLISKLSRPGGY